MELGVAEDKPKDIHTNPNPGGWKTFPFLTGSMVTMSIAAYGLPANLIVYLIQQFNIKSIAATQITNVVNGFTNLLPIAGAIISDSFLGSFPTIAISNSITMLGMILMTLTATIPSLRPHPCSTNSSQACPGPSGGQLAVLYSAFALAGIGVAGTRFNMVTMGASQFDTPADRESFINWYFCSIYMAFVIAVTGIVYVQDNVGWGWGYGICALLNAISILVFLAGRKKYRMIEPEGSPFTGLARVLVAAVRKNGMRLRGKVDSGDYYYGCKEGRGGAEDGSVEMMQALPPPPSKRFSFLNRAALKVQGDMHPSGSVAKPWKLCTVKHVEDLKTILSIAPLWSASFLLSTSIGVQASLSVLQALAMDRHLVSHFAIPAGSFSVFTLLSSAMSLILLDRLIYPFCMAHLRTPTLLQRLGIGHCLNCTGMVASALVEARRRAVLKSHGLISIPANAAAPMSALWLVLPLALVGLGEAFHLPGQVGLYYQDFPMALKNTATAAVAAVIGLGFYLSTAVVDLVQRSTNWLPNNINAGRLDNVYWMMSVVTLLNFGYFLICAGLYGNQSKDGIDESVIKEESNK
ncbi:hypothetical protein AMTRI_Chr08g206610 [Amborella trichopoda]